MSVLGAALSSGRHQMQTTQKFVDLASFVYLGLVHRPDELRPWDRFTSGRPAAADDEDFVRALADHVATLQGCEAATFATSTMHAYSDWCAAIGDDETAIFLDEDTYSITQWSVERAANRHVPIFVFRHHDADHLEFMLTRNQAPTRRPVVFVDGVSGTNWAAAPLRDYLRCIEHRSGILVVDDTQTIGLLGHSASPDAPYGVGGGGSLRWHEIESPAALMITSLAKAFGVPVAAVAGSRRLTDWFNTSSQTRMHCSPPSIPTFCALEHALDVNQSDGEELRRRLVDNVRQVRESLAPFLVPTDIPYFPVMYIPMPSEKIAHAIDAALRDQGIRVVFQYGTDGAINMALITTSAHTRDELEYATGALAEVLDDMKLDFHAVGSRSTSLNGLEPACLLTGSVWEVDGEKSPSPTRRFDV